MFLFQTRLLGALFLSCRDQGQREVRQKYFTFFIVWIRGDKDLIQFDLSGEYFRWRERKDPAEITQSPPDT